MDLSERCEREVRGLHEFFEGYFTGRRDDFERVQAALGPDFLMITPGGEIRSRGAVLSGIESSGGEYHDDFAIEIQGFEVRDATDDRCLVTYEEHQHDPDESTARISSALLVENEDAPEGVAWHHLQETWLPGRRPTE